MQKWNKITCMVQSIHTQNHAVLTGLQVIHHWVTTVWSKNDFSRKSVTESGKVRTHKYHPANLDNDDTYNVRQIGHTETFAQIITSDGLALIITQTHSSSCKWDKNNDPPPLPQLTSPKEDRKKKNVRKNLTKDFVCIQININFVPKIKQ